MTDEEYAKFVEDFNALLYTESNFEQKQRELDDWKKELEAEEKELCIKEKQLITKREKLRERMTEAELKWERVMAELDELTDAIMAPEE